MLAYTNLIRFVSLKLIVFGPMRTAWPHFLCHPRVIVSILPEAVKDALQASVTLAANGPGNAFNGEKKYSQSTLRETSSTNRDPSWVTVIEKLDMFNVKDGPFSDLFHACLCE